MPMDGRLIRCFSLLLPIWGSLTLPSDLAQAQTQGQGPMRSRSLADEMDSTNTATGRMLELVKAAKAQEQAAKGFGPASGDPPAKAGAALKKVTPAGPPESPEAPTLWYLAGVGDRLVAELIYQQRVYRLNSDSLPQSAGPWRLLSINHQGLQLSHQSGKTLTLHAPLPGQAAPSLSALPALLSTPAKTIVPPLVPGLGPAANIFPLPK
jgi:hypothetical protein